MKMTKWKKKDILNHLLSRGGYVHLNKQNQPGSSFAKGSKVWSYIYGQKGSLKNTIYDRGDYWYRIPLNEI